MHKNIEIFAADKIAELAKFAGGERRMSPDLICLIERSKLRMEDVEQMERSGGRATIF